MVVDREKAALLGISETDVANAVLFSLNGNGQTDPIIFTDPQNGNEYYISAWLAEEHRKDLTDIENVLLTTKNGEPVLLKNLATLKLNAGPVKIERKYFQRVVHITANPVDRDLGSIAQDLESAFDQLQLPPGFSIRLAGQIQQQRETFAGLMFASILALILVYMVMAAQFKSLIDPFIIMFSVHGHPGRHRHPLPDQHYHLNLVDDGNHHDARHRGVERCVAGGLHQCAAAPRVGVCECRGHGITDAAAPHPHDLAGHRGGTDAHGVGPRHRQRNECAAGPSCGGRSHRFDDLNPVPGSDRLCDVGGTVSAEHRTTG